MKQVSEASEIVGAIAIVISLFYVGYQVKLNTQAIEAETQHNIAMSLSDLYSMPIDNNLSMLITKARNDSESFTGIEMEQYFAYIAKSVAVFEDAWI